MSFPTVTFLLFVAATVLIYYIVPKRFQWVILLIASYIFYLSNTIPGVIFILFTTIITYLFALRMDKISDKCATFIADNKEALSKDELKAAKKKFNNKKKTWLVILILINLGILATVKYVPAIINSTSIRDMLYPDDSERMFKILVPLGISFYTFTTIGYAIDVYRNKYRATRHIGKFALFVSFFPSIIQGPISRFDDVGVQYNQPHKFDYDNFVKGLELILWGFFKKLVVADRLHPFVAEIFNDYANYDGIIPILGLLMYSLQIYSDFSGCIDITRGVAALFGIELPLNFERPYFARSVAEYWRRWHITLGNWMRDYVFFSVMFSRPYSKFSRFSRKKFGNTYGKIIPNFITTYAVFLSIGIWHGASLNYVLYGFYNATIIVGGMLLQPLNDKITTKLKINKESPNWQFFEIVRTFTILLGSKLLAHSASVVDAWYMFTSIFDLERTLSYIKNRTLFELGSIGQVGFNIVMVGAVVILVVSILQEHGISIRDTLNKKVPLIPRWALIILFIIFVFIYGKYNTGTGIIDPIYQRY
ncbi:MAG TPA: MBOAT family protein [Clostridiales bacterium]|nr:MBOAT family protein [Clostridiales bacterium]